MIITDFNEMSVFELDTLNKGIGLEFIIESGRITKVTRTVCTGPEGSN